jgi:hypothetical protein
LPFHPEWQNIEQSSVTFFATTNSKSIIKTVGKLEYATEAHNGLQSVDFHLAKHILPFHITTLLVPFYFKHTVNTKLTRQ